ncbi:MAG TPA: hypothetical protein VLA42_11080 [Verrucomicrobiae bacterium]|jgi:hypothetical protein|nr:hypothetical protein [Verrucomicrobiae bacterium]
MSEETNRLQSEKVEVSSNTAAEPVEVAPGPSLPPAIPLSQLRGANLSVLTPEERKARKKANDAESYKKRNDKKKVKSFVYDSNVEVSKAEAKEILTSRGLQNTHVIDLCYRLALVAAEQNSVPANRFLFQNGIRKMLASYEAQAPQALEAIPAEEVAGELLNRAELYAHYDFGFWRHPDTTFDQWLADRLKFKMSTFELSKILGKEDFGLLHKAWTDFAPRWNPLGLKPDYTQREALTWLDAQSETKRFLLIASRNSMKSTWARILALTLTITYPDARILIVSETNKLSKKAMKEFRGYLEMAPNNPTLFQQYFGEFTIAVDEGEKLIYDNPLAHLGLPQSSVESSSMESANTGSRFDFCLFDDPISRDNGTSNDDQRAEAVSKHGSIMKLREPAGYALNVQTPWVVGDLGDVMIKRNDDDPEKPLAVRIDPVMEIKREARRKDLLALTEDDVVLNFLPKLNWKFVRDEMRSPEGINFFKTQYLCQWIKDDEGQKVQFDHDEIWRRVKPMSYFQPVLGAENFLALDRSGGSVARYADFNAAVVGRLHRADDRQALVVVDAKLERAKDSELIVDVLIPLIIKHKVALIIFEEDRHWADFEENLRRELVRRGIPVPRLRHIAVDTTPSAKAKRVKRLELPLALGRLFFYSGIADLETCLLQLEKFDGRPSHSHKKDDFCDSLAILADAMLKRTHEEPVNPEEVERRQRAAEAEYENERRQAYHDRMVNGGQPVDRSIKHSEWQRQQRGEPQAPPPTPAREDNSPYAQLLKILPPGMRGINRR